jgi:hypothetical protein
LKECVIVVHAPSRIFEPARIEADSGHMFVRGIGLGKMTFSVDERADAVGKSLHSIIVRYCAVTRVASGQAVAGHLIRLRMDRDMQSSSPRVKRYAYGLRLRPVIVVDFYRMHEYDRYDPNASRHSIYNVLMPPKLTFGVTGTAGDRPRSSASLRPPRWLCRCCFKSQHDAAEPNEQEATERDRHFRREPRRAKKPMLFDERRWRCPAGVPPVTHTLRRR